jgi:ABC-type transporter Mla subunit MlaD
MSEPAHPQPVAELLAQHRDLKQLLTRIESVLTEQTASIDEAAHLLGQLGDQLVKHFALEEAGGYFSEALTQAPQLVARANDLLAQHPKMTHLVKQLTTAQPDANWWRETHQRFQAFTAELLRHERSEDQLLQEAYVRDIAATD